MAFKMKGSAFKLNNVATKSALKQTKEVKEEAGQGPLPQKLSIGEKLQAAGGVFDVIHPESNFGDLYDYYKTGKKNMRAEKRRSKKRAKRIVNAALNTATARKKSMDKE